MNTVQLGPGEAVFSHPRIDHARHLQNPPRWVMARDVRAEQQHLRAASSKDSEGNNETL